MDYVLSSQVGNIKTQGNRELKKVLQMIKNMHIIKKKTVLERLKKKLKSILKTPGAPLRFWSSNI